MEIKITEVTASQTWKLRHRVMWPDKALDYVKLPQDSKGIHWALWKNEKMIAVVSLFIKGEEGQFRKLATDKSEQGKGYGTQLLKYLMTQVESRSLKRIWCNARIDKVSFYHKFEMEETNHFFSKGGIDYVIMERYFE